jgi:hypothetical protein
MYLDTTIEFKISKLWKDHAAQVVKLIDAGWQDTPLALYFGTDRKTIYRVRKRLATGVLQPPPTGKAAPRYPSGSGHLVGHLV